MIEYPNGLAEVAQSIDLATAAAVNIGASTGSAIDSRLRISELVDDVKGIVFEVNIPLISCSRRSDISFGSTRNVSVSELCRLIKSKCWQNLLSLSVSNILLADLLCAIRYWEYSSMHNEVDVNVSA